MRNSIALVASALLLLAPLGDAQTQIPAGKTTSESTSENDRTRFYDVNFLFESNLDGIPRRDRAGDLAKTEQLVENLLRVINGPKRGLESASAQSHGLVKVVGQDAAHEYVTEFIAAQRNFSGVLTISMLMLEMPAGHLKELGIEGSSSVFQIDEEYTKLLNRLREDDQVNVVNMPSVSFRPAGAATISTISQISYISDYVLQIVEPGHTEILDPIVEVINEGFETNIKGLPIPGDLVQFDLDVNYSVLQRPIPTVKTRIQSGESKEVEISLPVLDSINLKSVLALPVGSAALISAAAPTEGLDFVVILEYPKPESHISPRVEALFDSMRAGTYSHRWFPPLQWDDIPSLLAYSGSERILKSFPSNPISSQSTETCAEGIIALWLIEGIWESGNLPSLNPILLQSGSKISTDHALSMDRQVALMKKARTAYSAWWQTVNQSRFETGPALTDTGLYWY
jgi:hypothetical protein